MSINSILKNFLDQKGWFLRRMEGIPEGIDLATTLRRLGLAPDSIVFDVGAHRGETVSYFHEKFSASIFAFEPIQANFKFLSERWGPVPQVQLFNMALGESVGSSTILLQSDSQTHSLLKTAPNHELERTEAVQVTTVDGVCREENVDHIDLLKIDTEGYEIQVFEGARQMFEEGRIRSVFCEVTFDPDDREHTHFSLVLEHLSKYKFRFCGLFDQVIWQTPIRLAYANALFIREQP